MNGNVRGTFAQCREGDGFSDASVLAGVPIDGLPLGGGFVFAEGEVEAVPGAVIGEVVGKKPEADLRVALWRAQVEIHADGLGVSGELAAEERAVSAGANRGVIFNHPSALFINQSFQQSSFCLAVGEDPFGGVLESLN